MGFGVVRVVRTGRRVTWRIPVTVHSQSVHGYLLRWPRESDAGERRQTHDQRLAAHIHMGLIEHSKRLVHLPSTKSPRELFQHIQTRQDCQLDAFQTQCMLTFAAKDAWLATWEHKGRSTDFVVDPVSLPSQEEQTPHGVYFCHG